MGHRFATGVLRKGSIQEGDVLPQPSRIRSLGRRVAIVVVLCVLWSTTSAKAWPPWEERPTIFPMPVASSHAFVENRHFPSTNDYLQSTPVAIAGIGVSVRDGVATLSDGFRVRGAEVITVDPRSPAALAGIESSWIRAKDALQEVGAVFAIIVTPLIPVLQAVDNSSLFDNSDVIFAADGERIRNTLELVARVQGLKRGDRLYLTIARRGRRVQTCAIVF
jgi:S1-C subfamily serine protease